MANRCRRQLSFVLILFLGACATPDLQSFATQTANLANAVNAEQATVSGKFTELKALAETGVAEGWGLNANNVSKGPAYEPATYADFKSQYEDSARVVSETLQAIVNYSQALVNLAASGEDGEKAVKSVTSAIEGVSSALGTANPAALLGAGATKALSEVARIIGRIQSQKSLKKVMGVVEKEDLTGQFKNLITDIYGEIDKTIFRALATNEKALKRAAFGIGKRSVARQAARAEIARFRMLANLFAADSNKSECKSPRDVRTLAAAEEFAKSCFRVPGDLFVEDIQLKGVIADYRAHLEDLAAIDAWRDLHLTQSKNIVAAVKVWNTEHTSMYEAIRQCGGFRVLKKSCGQLTFANLGSAAKRIQELVKGIKNDQKEATS